MAIESMKKIQYNNRLNNEICQLIIMYRNDEWQERRNESEMKMKK